MPRLKLPPAQAAAAAGQSPMSLGAQLMLTPMMAVPEGGMAGMMGRAKQMGEAALDLLRKAGYDVPEGGFRSMADIDRLLGGPAAPPVVPPTPKVPPTTPVSDLRFEELLKKFGMGQQ